MAACNSIARHYIQTYSKDSYNKMPAGQPLSEVFIAAIQHIPRHRSGVCTARCYTCRASASMLSSSCRSIS